MVCVLTPSCGLCSGWMAEEGRSHLQQLRRVPRLLCSSSSSASVLASANRCAPSYMAQQHTHTHPVRRAGHTVGEGKGRGAVCVSVSLCVCECGTYEEAGDGKEDEERGRGQRDAVIVRQHAVHEQ